MTDGDSVTIDNLRDSAKGTGPNWIGPKWIGPNWLNQDGQNGIGQSRSLRAQLAQWAGTLDLIAERNLKQMGRWPDLDEHYRTTAPSTW